MLADTYIAIFRTSAFLEQVCDRVNDSSEIITDGTVSRLDGKKIGNMLDMAAVNATEVLQIKATSINPQLSVDICYAIVEEAETVLRKTMNTFTVNSVEGDNILIPTKPSSPSAFSKAQFGALIGFLGSCIVIAGIYIIQKQFFGIDTAANAPARSASNTVPRKAYYPTEPAESNIPPVYNAPASAEDKFSPAIDPAQVKIRRNLKPGRQTPSQKQ